MRGGSSKAYIKPKSQLGFEHALAAPARQGLGGLPTPAAITASLLSIPGPRLLWQAFRDEADGASINYESDRNLSEIDPKSS